MSGPIVFEINSWVWIPDAQEMYIPGKVLKTFRSGEEGRVRLEDGKEVAVTVAMSKDALPMDEAALKQYDNMIKLNDLNEPTILHNLRQRFMKDEIYTYVSSILVACNPFKLLPIYTPDIMEKYKDGGGRTMPPHIYAIADNAYRSLLADFKDQAVVISGESGAGKTETMKLVLQFLADVSGRAQKQTTTGEKAESLEQQILKSNPVMEAFGNAKTTRNNNSSRFGKWTEIKFNRFGTIVGGSIINYLLEKSRIPFQAPQERNYHIFYQLLAGAEIDLDMKKRYKLRDAEEFHYMNQSGVTTVDTINDEKDWLEMSSAMDVLNMTADEKECVFRLIAAILHLGNVEFDRDPKGSEETDSKVKNVDQLKIASELLRVDNDAFAKCLCFKKISRPGARSITYARYSITKATDARDATTKALYGKLFDWLIGKINMALSGMVTDMSAAGKDKLATIGVLDIFGFESFQTNSFEQLCINYCNEKLQFHFNEYIFKLEQAEYASEGVPVDLIEFKDNQPTLDLLEAKGTGIFAMIDEEINVPKGTDETMLKKVLAKHAKHSNFAAPKPKDFNAHLVFVVVHYAGAVPYNVTSFLEKNKDALHEDIVEVVNSSKCPLVSTLLRDAAEADTSGKAKRKSPTLGFQFKTSLDGLMTALYRCEPHFVRCMKSNHQKKGNVFESEMMMAQLRYAGLLEVCRIRKVGFPVRKKFDEFVFRYRCLDLTAAKDHLTLTAAMEKKGFLKPRQWCIGHTKVFMKNQQQQELEEAREKSLMNVVMKIQAAARRFIARCRFHRYRAILNELRNAIARRTEEALETALADAPELPYRGVHVKEVKEARALKERLEEERRVTNLCQEAIKNRDLAELKNACKAADDIVFTSPVVEQAKQLRDLMEREKAAIKRMKDAIDARSLDELVAAITAAEPFGGYVTDTDTYRQACNLRERIIAENAARAALAAAIKSRDLPQLVAALATVHNLNLQEPIVKEAEALKAEIEEQLRAISQLVEAIKERTLEAVQSALKNCKKVGVADDHASIVQGKELEARLIDQKSTEDELNAAADARDVARMESGLKKAEKLGMVEVSHAAKKAIKTLEIIREENEAVENLRQAIKSNKASALRSALSKVNQLGLNVKEADTAKELLSKLGEQSEALLRLSEAVKNGNLAGIDKELAALQKMGVGTEEEEVRAALEAKTQIAAQNAAADKLQAAVESRDKAAIEAALQPPELKMGGRFSDLIAKAEKILDTMRQEEALIKGFTNFIENEDEEALDAAVEKARGFGAGREFFASAEEAKVQIRKRREISKKLTEAVADPATDKTILQALLEEAQNLGMKGAAVEAAQLTLNREKVLKDARKALKKAAKGTDTAALAEAIEKAIQLGLEGEELTHAKEVKVKLEEEKELAADVRAALKAVTVKAESKTGITEADIEPLEKAIQEAKEKGLSDDSPFMQEALAAKDKIRAVLQLQTDIAAALEGGSLRAMKKLLDKAEDLELAGSSLVKKLRARIREEEAKRSAAAMAEDEPAEPVTSLDDEEMKRQREEKLKKAKNPKFEWVRYPKIRNADDYCRGVFLNKKKIKASQLRWQNSVIPTSIIEFDSKELAKLGTRIHKCILGYTGDRSMSFPATLAQDILQKGLETPELVDEIYVQLCKHITNNPRPESTVRAWQLMCMCVGTFPPSRDFESYLINFILQSRDGAGAVGNYARYSLRRLEGILNSGPSGFVPSVDEIQAYKERPPILATIELVDGTPLTEDLPITPDLNVAKVLDICYHFLELTDPRMHYFGIFVEDVDDPTMPVIDASSEDAPPYAGLPKTPRPLQNEYYMGEVVTLKVRQNQPFKFVFKRKIFLRNFDGPSEDPMFERLTYLQAVDEVINGNIPIDNEEDVLRLTTQAMVVDLLDAFPDNAEELEASDLLEYIPKRWRKEKSATRWSEKVLKHYQKFKDEEKRTYADIEAEELQGMYVDAVREHPLYGTCFFHVRKNSFPEHMNSFPEHCIIALNYEGLHFLNEERETLASYGYADIYRWGGSSTQFSIIVWNAESGETENVTMFTSQAADMAALILDYINAIMAANEA